ncbi:MBL fold metallo-hydrolase [Pantoea septica]|uniref:MBL fold metallo-hydrolase n=1 Tax=Pantoea septica TaxID=472695 RepID=UPI0028A81C8D|nr:MBL fold metallo-hydrolase [Pantoea septica]
MRVHHLNCGCMCPFGGALYDGFSRSPLAHLSCHCLLLETDTQGLVLVDTGIGLQDMAHRGRLSGFFRLFNNIQFDRRLSAWQQIVDLGFKPEDVRHIILTHLDFDHAGGISDFPQARVHLLPRRSARAGYNGSASGRSSGATTAAGAATPPAGNAGSASMR